MERNFAPLQVVESWFAGSNEERRNELVDLNFIYAIDPGVTTGVSVIGFTDPNVSSIKVWGGGQLSYGGSGNAKDLVQGDSAWVEQKISKIITDNILALDTYTKNPVYVVIEDFVIRRADSSRDFLSPVRITAGIMQGLYREDIQVFFQQPSEAKGTCTDDRLDKWGFKIDTRKDRHSRDADRHAILLMRKFAEKPQLRSTK